MTANSLLNPAPNGSDGAKYGRVVALSAVAVVAQHALQLPHTPLTDAHQRCSLVVL